MKALSIGRGTDCNIILNDAMISRRHAILKIHATGKMEIVDMGQNGTFVNGVKLSSNVAYPVSRKDVVSFAHVRQLDWSQIPDPMKYYRYGAIGIIGFVAVIGVFILLFSFFNMSGSSDAPQSEQVEKVIPTDKSPSGKEGAGNDSKAEKKDSTQSKGAKDKAPSVDKFFPKPKKPKEDKKPQPKEETPQKEKNPIYI